MENTAKLSHETFIPYSKSPHHVSNSSLNKPSTHRSYSFCNKSSGTSINEPSTSNSTLQIRLPHRRQLKPPKKITTTTTTTTSTTDVLRLMDVLSISIPTDIYASLIKECTETRDLTRAIELHSHITRSFTFPSLTLLNRVLIMYVSIGCIENARQLFDKMTTKDFNSWAVLIAGYVENDDYEQVIDLFVNFLQRCSNGNINGLPVSWILVCVLKACVHTMNLELGKQVHGWLLKAGYSTDLFLSSSLINFYGKIGWSEDADLVFGQISNRNVVIWTAKIVNNCKEERYDEVLNVFNEMGKEGVKKNSFTLSSVLRACAKMSDDGHCGGQVHANAIKLGLASKSYVQCGLVNMYGKFGLIRDAKRLFEMNESKRNNACWNAMLSSYIQHGFYIEAIKILYQMKAAGVQPQEVLVNELRSASGSEILESMTDEV